MSRPARGYSTELLRARIRKEYYAEVMSALSQKNLFNPEKPAHGDISALVEQLLMDWLEKELSPAQFQALPQRRIPRI